MGWGWEIALTCLLRGSAKQSVIEHGFVEHQLCWTHILGPSDLDCEYHFLWVSQLPASQEVWESTEACQTQISQQGEARLESEKLGARRGCPLSRKKFMHGCSPIQPTLTPLQPSSGWDQLQEMSNSPGF